MCNGRIVALRLYAEGAEELSHGTVGTGGFTSFRAKNEGKKDVSIPVAFETTARIRGIPVTQKRAPAGRSVSASDLS